MYIAGSGGCQITVDEPAALVVALYLREIIRLPGLTNPDIPPLDPPITHWPIWAHRPHDVDRPGLIAGRPDPFDGTLDREQTGLEWARWWRYALAVGSAAGDDLRPPRFASFTGTPLLKQLLQMHHDRAVLWADAISSDPRVKRDLAAPRDGLVALAGQLESSRSRAAEPLRLRITVIPVQTQHGWQLAPDHVVVTRHLIGARDNVLDWLRHSVFALT